MQKNGTLILSQEDIASIKQGVLPQHLHDNWGLTLSELQVMIEASLYQPNETLELLDPPADKNDN